jgi:hypothetical protein
LKLGGTLPARQALREFRDLWARADQKKSRKFGFRAPVQRGAPACKLFVRNILGRNFKRLGGTNYISEGRCSALGNLGRTYAELGQTKKAIGLHKRDLAIARELRNLRGIANALGDLGNGLVAFGGSWFK